MRPSVWIDSWRDLACPKCAYSLRGLWGDAVICPECGSRCELVELLQRGRSLRLRLPPRHTVAVLPALTLAVTCGAATGSELLEPFNPCCPGPSTRSSILFASGFLTWILSNFFMFARYGVRRFGPLFALSHAVLIGYAGSFVTAAFCATFAYRSHSASESLTLLGFIVPCACVFAACISGERCLARWCRKRDTLEA